MVQRLDVVLLLVLGEQRAGAGAYGEAVVTRTAIPAWRSSAWAAAASKANSSR